MKFFDKSYYVFIAISCLQLGIWCLLVRFLCPLSYILRHALNLLMQNLTLVVLRFMRLPLPLLLLDEWGGGSGEGAAYIAIDPLNCVGSLLSLVSLYISREVSSLCCGCLSLILNLTARSLGCLLQSSFCVCIFLSLLPINTLLTPCVSWHLWMSWSSKSLPLPSFIWKLVEKRSTKQLPLMWQVLGMCV